MMLFLQCVSVCGTQCTMLMCDYLFSVFFPPFLVLLCSSLAIRKTSSELLSLWSLSCCSSRSTLWRTHSRLLSTFNQSFSWEWNSPNDQPEEQLKTWEVHFRGQLLHLTHSSSCSSACKEALFLVTSLPSGGITWREGEVAARDGEVGWREGERDGEREEGESEVEEGDGLLRWVTSGRAAARARMAEESSLESHTATNWRVCGRSGEEEAGGEVTWRRF